ncbi:MAG: hypothetical protein IJV97_00850 [Alphaproteobacteria bacterium]|nr:hypothetical protein [Alphaproteobacteria bacterium]
MANKDAIQLENENISRVAEINNSKNLDQYTYADLADVMTMLQDKALSNTAGVKAAIVKVQAAIDKRLEAVSTGNEPLSVDDLSALNQLMQYGKNKQTKKKVQQVIDGIVAEYEEANGLNLGEEVLRKNDATLDQHLSEMNLYEGQEVHENFSDLQPVVSRVSLVDDEQDKILSDKEKAENLKLLFEAAKIETYRKHVGSIKYLMSTQAEQKQMLAESAQEIFMAKLGQAALASEITPPTVEELQDEAKLQAYIERTDKEAKEKLQQAINSKEKIVAKTENIIASCAQTDVENTYFSTRLNERIGESKFSSRLENFRKIAKGLWKNKYKIAREIGQNIKDNRLKVTLDLLGTLGVGVAMSTATAPVIAGAFVAYGLHSMAGAYWGPVLAEANKLRRIANEQGQTLKFNQAKKLAWAKLKDSRDYKRNARWSAAGGFLGAVLGVGSLGLGLRTAIARAGSFAGRLAGSTSSQIHGYITAKRDYERKQTKETEARLNGAKLNLGLGVIISTVSASISLNHIKEDALQDVLASFKDIVENISEKTGDISDSVVTKLQDIDIPKWQGLGKPENITESLPTVADTSEVLTTDTSAVSQPVSYEPVAIVEEISVPQAGDILSQKDHGNGIVETITLGADGRHYQDVIGLSGGIETTEGIQAFYERRTSNMNQFNYLINMIEAPDGKFMDANQAVEAMKQQIELGFVELPEGLTAEHAIHTAFMHGHYTGDMSAINALSCPNGEDTVEMFSRLSFKYSTDAGFIGRPVDPDVKLPMQAGTIDVKTPCEPVISSPIEEVEPIIPPAVEPVIIDEVGVTYAAEPQATVEYPSAYAGKDTYPTNGDADYQLFMEDRKGDGLTATTIYAPDNREGYRLTGDNRITLGIDTENEDIVAFQTQRQFNIRDGYLVAPESTINQLAEVMGGKVGEAFTYVDGDKEYIKYISQAGTVVTFDPDNNYQAVVENAVQGQGVPLDIQKETVEQAIASINEQRNGELALNGFQKPQSDSALTRITTPKGNIYARIAVRGGR